MKFLRRNFLCVAACVMPAVMGVASTAHAQGLSGNRPLTLVVPYSAGGPTDVMARTLSNAIKQTLPQGMIVDNKPGAGANIGAELVARAEANGQTLLFGTSAPLAINVSLFKKINYDPIKSFAPVIHIGHLPNVLLVHPGVPANNVQELIAYAKSKPKQLSFASSGNGASSHLAGVMFNVRAGTDIQHIPYKGTGPALNDLLGGQVTMAFTDVLTAQPHVQAGKLKALAVTTATRSQIMPQVPTIMEQGIKDYDVSVFFGIVAPANTPPAVVQQLNAAFVQALEQPEVRKTLTAQGLETSGKTTPAYLTEYMQTEITKWRDVIATTPEARVD